LTNDSLLTEPLADTGEAIQLPGGKEVVSARLSAGTRIWR